MTKFDVVGFGALNVDELFKVNKIAGKEEESFVVESKESCGGSAANTIVGLARLGLETGYVGKVADDREGRLLLGGFRIEGVDTNGIVIAKSGRSGVVMGFVGREGERALYVAPGVNDTIDLKEVNADYIRGTKLLHLTSFVGEKSFESQKKLVEQLPANVRVSFDPGMLYAKRGLSALRPIIKRAFVMFPNETELKLLTRKEYEDAAKMLIAEGVKVVGVKLGGKGCFVSNSEESYVIEPFKVKVVDTTGAGDAWNAGFLYGLLENKSLLECGRLGNLAASKCITKMGARTGLPRLDDLH
ncbi:MAG: carbohydrate kinase family protein [Candidatus Bathyarchaeota archaeon]|nr:carbohydrate kinase family protein [Candidatus Bathyarchaeota archaeon]MDH5495775.1 carbohydrate kinase family protein [Candidatus Bathyarchaeota archaeon]